MMPLEQHMQICNIIGLFFPVINILWVELLPFVNLLKEKSSQVQLCLHTWHNRTGVCLLGEKLVCACMSKWPRLLKGQTDKQTGSSELRSAVRRCCSKNSCCPMPGWDRPDRAGRAQTWIPYWEDLLDVSA